MERKVKRCFKDAEEIKQIYITWSIDSVQKQRTNTYESVGKNTDALKLYLNGKDI
jgi:hypothetical protein